MKKYLAMLLVLTLLFLTGCGSVNKSASVSSDTSASLPEPAAAPAEAAPAGDNSYDYGSWDMPVEAEEAPMPEQPEASDAQTAQPAVSTEKLIYRAYLHIETLDFDGSVAELNRLASALGGFVESSNVSGNTNWQPDGTTRIVDRWADYVLRVPSNRFQEAVSQTGKLGSVTSSETSVENITSQFTDQEARKHSLEVQEDRLLEMLGKAENIDTLIMLESRLSEVRYEIESIERQLRNWQNQVDYSTISVSLQEVAVYTPTATVQRSFGERMGNSLRDGWMRFTASLENLSLSLAGALPMLALLAILIVVGALTARKIVRRRRKRNAGSQQTPTEEEKRDSK